MFTMGVFSIQGKTHMEEPGIETGDLMVSSRQLLPPNHEADYVDNVQRKMTTTTEIKNQKVLQMFGWVQYCQGICHITAMHK